MTPLPVAWPITVVIALNLCICAYVIGTTRMTRYQDTRIEWVVNQHRRLNARLQHLEAALPATNPIVHKVYARDVDPDPAMTNPIGIPTTPTHQAITPEAITAHGRHRATTPGA